MTKTFSAAMTEWNEKAKRNLMLVMRQATQYMVRDLLQDVGKGAGQTPILTGNLRRSLLASTSAMPSVRKDADFKASNNAQIALTIAQWVKGEPLYLGFQAAYAMRLNYGFVGVDKLGRSYNQAGRYFVESKVKKWPEYVARAAKEIGS